MNKKQCMAAKVDENVVVKVIGSMPGEVSLAKQEYYGHPKNLFWKFVEEVFPDINFDSPYTSRVQGLIKHHIGLWDVLQVCEREGSLDSAIKNALPNDFSVLSVQVPHLKKLLFNGRKAYDSFMKSPNKAWADNNHISCVLMPSTSPANASIPQAEKLRRWRQELLVL